MPRFIDAEKIDLKTNLLAVEEGELYIALSDVKKAIAQTPTEYMPKIRSGEWVRDKQTRWKHRYFCSVCDFFLIAPPSNYCPNCGARMKGE